MKKISVFTSILLITLVAYAALPERFKSGVIFDDQTASRALYVDSNKQLQSSAVTDTELGYLSGVTSALQTQIDAIDTFDELSPMTTAGDIIYGGASGTGTRLGVGTDDQVLTLVSGAPAWADASGGAGAGAFVNLAAEQSLNWNAETGDTTNFAETGGGTLAIETTEVFQGANSISYDASAASDYVTFGPVNISSLDNNNCMASFWYKGFDANITAQVWDGTNVLNSSEMVASTDWARQENGMSFVCNDATTSNLYIRLLADADAAIGYIDNIWTGENYLVGLTPPQDVFSALVTDGSSTTTVSQENEDWIDGDCTNGSTGAYVCTFVSGFFNVTPNCWTANVGTSVNSVSGNVHSVSASSVSIDMNATSGAFDGDFQLSCQKQGADAVTVATARDMPGSKVRVNTHNGYGSTNTVIPRFTTTVEDVGSAITYADSSTDGASFTIEKAGVYSISHTHGSRGSAGIGYAGISLNSTELTTAIITITAADRLASDVHSSTVAHSTGAYTKNASWTGWLDKGDVIRPHVAAYVPDTAAVSSFSIYHVTTANSAAFVKNTVVTSLDGVVGIESAQVVDGAATTTVTELTGDWIDGACTNPSAGVYACTIKAGVFSARPNCWGDRDDVAVANNVSKCVPLASSATNVDIDCSNSGGTNADLNFHFTCLGPR